MTHDSAQRNGLSQDEIQRNIEAAQERTRVLKKRHQEELRTFVRDAAWEDEQGRTHVPAKRFDWDDLLS